MKQKIGVYSGTFDPFTLGHLDIAQRACKIFDRLIVAVATAHHKTTLFPLTKRIEQVTRACQTSSNIEVLPFEGLLVDFCVAHGATVIVRGVRNHLDLDYEAQMAAMNQKMHPEIETLLMMPTPDVQCISSTLVREIAKLKGDVSKMVCPHILQDLEQKTSWH